MSLNTALNIPGGTLDFATGGHADWFDQSVVTHDGVAAGQSGDIDDSQYSFVWIIVNGPGTIKFWWKVSSEEGYDELHFMIDAGWPPVAEISGEVGWSQQIIEVSPGEHLLEWEYWKDGSESVGSDAGWLDEVEWVPGAEEGLVEIESEVSGVDDREDGLVEIESEVVSWDNREDGEVLIESEVLGGDWQHYREYCQIHMTTIVRLVVPWLSPPGLTGRNPAPDETRVRRNQPVSFVLYSQNQDPVDLQSVSVVVNGVEYQDGDPEFFHSGTSDRYEIDVRVPQWQYEQLVSVVINASSTMGVAMSEASYSFTVEWDAVLTRRGMGRIEIYEVGKYGFDILTIQEDWVRQGTARETTDLEMWFGRYLELPAIEDVEIRVRGGDTNALGKEVLEHGYFNIKVGDGPYVSMFDDTVVHLGPVYTNTHRDIQFKLFIPDGAETKRYVLLEIEVIPKMMRTWGRFPWGVGIYSSDINLFNFHPNKVFYRAYVFNSAMWQGLEQVGIVISPFYRGEDKQW